MTVYNFGVKNKKHGKNYRYQVSRAVSMWEAFLSSEKWHFISRVWDKTVKRADLKPKTTKYRGSQTTRYNNFKYVCTSGICCACMCM